MTTPIIVPPVFIPPKVKKPCKHIISLQNLAATTNAFKVRISAFTPATQILSSSVSSGWTQTASYPTHVVWQPATGGAIPSGSPLPGIFSITVQNDAQQDKRVLIEWLSNRDELLCRQVLLVGCGKFADFVPEGWPKSMPNRDGTFCRCLSAETKSDEDSEQFSEPDLSVELGTPFDVGFLQVIVPYTIEVEPAQLSFTRQWEVTVLDELGDEQPIIIPFTDNLTGQATFNLPEAGDYNFYLTVTDPATCVSAHNQDPDEYTDMDFTSYRITSEPTKISTIATDPCNPLEYKFTDITDPVGTSPVWTVTNSVGTILTAPNPNSSVSYTFPNFDTYNVCLVAIDPTSNPPSFRPQSCQTVIVSKTEQVEVGFGRSYSSCPEHNFVVQFVDKSKTPKCPITWLWDFGDGNTSSQQNPVHTYTDPGGYSVTLTLTILGPPDQVFTYSEKVVIEHWKPDITFTICPDGHVIYKTTALCNRANLFSPCRRTWDFPGGQFHKIHKHKDKIRVCYDTPGTKLAMLTATNKNNGTCEARVEVNIPSPLVRCCPHDKVKLNQSFTYKGKNYRMRMVFKYHGKLPGRIFAKTKLQVQKNGIWRRKRANSIEVSITGNIFSKESNGCFGANNHSVSVSKTRSNRAKVAKWHLPMVGSFKVKQGDLACTHTIKIDASHSGEIHINNLWVHDCHCG